MRRLTYTAIFLSLAASCVSPRDHRQERTDPADDPVASLRRRVERLWSAKEAQDWATVYQFQDPAELNEATKEEFITWCVEEEPFRVISYQIDHVETGGGLGWVDVHYRVSLNKFPDIPARDAETWQKWHQLDGTWYPVPVRQLDLYPVAPSKRDLSAEEHLRARFQESWAARQARDWSRLYALTDPADRAEVSEEEYAGVEGLFEYLGNKVDWIEVIDQRGRIRVSYEHKVTDASLRKLPAMTANLVEKWILRDGEWYRDLKTE